MAEDKNQSTKKYISNVRKASFFQRLSAYFGFTKKGEDSIQVTVPQVYKASQNLNLIKFTKMNETVEEMIDKYISETYTNYASASDRLERVNELTWLIDNSSKASLAVDTIVDEVVWTHSSNCVYAKSPDQKQQKYLEELIDRLHLNTALLREITRDLASYGECYLGLSVSEEGIQEVSKLPQTAIKQKLEFSYVKAQAYFNSAEAGDQIPTAMLSPFFQTMTGQTGPTFGNGINATSFFKDYLSNMEDHQAVEFSQAFKMFNFGYIGEDGTYYFPWDIIHIRLSGESSLNEFWPYDRPPLITAVAAFKQYTNNLARANLLEDLSVPYTTYEVDTPGVSPAADFDFVQEVRSEFESNGVTPDSGDQELPAVNTSVWLAKNLVSITDHNRTKENSSQGSQELAKLFDQEVTNGTGIPKVWLDLGGDNFSKDISGVALQELCRPFERKCQTYRNALMDGLAQIANLDAVIKQKDLEPFAFKMTLVPKTSDFNTEFQQYIDAIFAVVGSALGVAPEDLPLFIKRDIIYKYSPVSKADIVKYTNQMEKDDLSNPYEVQSDGEELGAGEGGSSSDFDSGSSGGGDEGGSEDIPTFGESTKIKKNRLYESYKALDLNRLFEVAIFKNKSDSFVTSDGALVKKFNQRSVNDSSTHILNTLVPKKLKG